MPTDPFTAFVQETTPKLLGRARTLTADPHDAWDLVQETLARIGERWDRLDEPAASANTVMTRQLTPADDLDDEASWYDADNALPR